MSIASAEPDQHHGTGLITTYCSLTIFTDLPETGVDCVGRSVSSQVLSDHTRLFTAKGMVRRQAGETTYSRLGEEFQVSNNAGLGLEMRSVE